MDGFVQGIIPQIATMPARNRLFVTLPVKQFLSALHLGVPPIQNLEPSAARVSCFMLGSAFEFLFADCAHNESFRPSFSAQSCRVTVTRVPAGLLRAPID